MAETSRRRGCPREMSRVADRVARRRRCLSVDCEVLAEHDQRDRLRRAKVVYAARGVPMLLATLKLTVVPCCWRATTKETWVGPSVGDGRGGRGCGPIWR